MSAEEDMRRVANESVDYHIVLGLIIAIWLHEADFTSRGVVSEVMLPVAMTPHL